MKLFRYLAIVALLVLGSCSKEGSTFLESGSKVKVTLRGINSAPSETRLYFGEPDGGKIPFLWDEGDRIGIYLSQNDIAVPLNENLKTTLSSGGSSTGAGTPLGRFEATLSNIEPNNNYNLNLYFPWSVDAGNSSGQIAHRLSPFQVQSEASNSRHLTKAGGFASAVVDFTTPASLAGFSPDLSFTLTHQSAYIQFNLWAQSGEYSGWKVKTISIAAPADIPLSGNMNYNSSSDELTLKDGESKTNSVTLEIESPIVLSTTKQYAYMALFPTDVRGKELIFTYTLENPLENRLVELKRVRSVSSSATAFEKGTLYTIDEEFPALFDSQIWSSKEISLDINYYKEIVKGYIVYANIPSIQVKYSSNTQDISFAVVNEAFYQTAPVQEVAPIGINTIYQAASISKIVFAYAVMRLNDRGIIDLDTPLWEYYPGLLEMFSDQQNQEKAKVLTARMALTHITGLDNSTYSNISFVREPGTYGYSGPGTYLLQKTVEHITGKLVDQIAQEEVFTPLGMEHTSYVWKPEYETTAARGYLNSGSWGWNPWSSSAISKDGNVAYTMRTNAEEITIFMKAMMKGVGLSREKYEEMISAHGNFVAAAVVGREKQSIYRALGFVIEKNEELGDIIWHTGNNQNFKGMTLFIADRNITLSYFVNGQHSFNLNDPIVKLFLKNKYPLSSFGSGTFIPTKNDDDPEGNAGSSPIIRED
ncbi:MAG: serine hydrolase domain-containing protein [Bacteroidales bacterium]